MNNFTFKVLRNGKAEMAFNMSEKTPKRVALFCSIKRNLSLLMLLMPFMAFAQSPGGVSNNLYLWTKADTGVVTTGSNVSQWTNMAPTSMITQATKTANANVTLGSAGFNYNPSIIFNGTSGERLSGRYTTPSANPALIFVVANKNGSNGGTCCSGPFSTSPAGSMGVFYNDGSADGYGVDGAGTICNITPTGIGVTAIARVDYNSTSVLTGASASYNGLLSSGSACSGGSVVSADGIFEIGGRTYGAIPSRVFTGSIGEVIHYNVNSLPNTTADILRIESYLAIKYGITLSNSGGGTNGDYISSAASVTTIWDADNGAAYHNNIIGIGRDGNATLKQKQSHQADDSVRIYASTLAASNAANTASIGNTQFVMMGSNTGNLFFSASNTEFPSGLSLLSRMNKEWKITNTAFTGTFSLDVKPASGTYNPTSIKILIDDDGNFSNGGTVMYKPTVRYVSGVLTISGITTAMIPANSTRYITIVSTASPAGIANNLGMWNKANTGLATSGSNVSAWTDQTINNAFAITGTPTLVASALNYNPSVLFNGSSRFTGNTAISNITHAFAVGKINNSLGSGSGAMIGSAGSAPLQYFFHTESNILYCGGTTAGAYTGIANGSNNVSYSILSEDLAKTPAASDQVRMNGTAIANAPGGDPDVITSSVPTIGSRATENFANGSEVSEAILYTTSLTATQTRQVESYLALKYGLTLPTNYLSSAAAPTTLYDVSSYGLNVIGIGRDDSTGLYQKQSHQMDDSVRIYIGSLNASNAGNSGTYSGNVQYVMMGSNTQRLKSSGSTEFPTGQSIFSRIDREWKITNTNFTSTFSLDIALNTTPVTASHLRILIDDDGNFANATVFNPTVSYSSGMVTISGISNAMIPSGTTRYLTIASINSITPLPVSLINFTAKAVANTYVQLDWQTTDEINCANFSIERSRDGIVWIATGEIKCANTAGDLFSYTFNDNNAPMGTLYYRLKQVDVNGKYTYSIVRSVELQSVANGLVIYPNPANSQITIVGNEIAREGFKIYDMWGKDVTDNAILINNDEKSMVVNIETLAKGIYLLKTDAGAYKLIKD